MNHRRLPRGTDNNGLTLGELAPGTRMGEFIVESRIPTRGTGHVYVAVHALLPRHATIHVLPAADGPSKAIALEHLREACVVDAIDHPGMPRVFECGMLAGRQPWIASELIEGHTVELLLDSGDVPVPEVLAILRDVSDILATSHRRGLVHGHVAPASIVYPAHPRRFRLCLVDWVGARTHDSKTPLPLVVGSPYVAPEQANAIAVTERSDVYSLGKVCRALLDRANTDDVSPLLVTLLESMTAESPSARPRSSDVHSTAAWLAKELAPQLDADFEPERSGLITSETSPAVSGEIRLPPEPFSK